MENIKIPFNNAVSDLFKAFLQNDDLEKLIARLRAIEKDLGTEIWFRFYKDDTLVTTIKDIETDLSLPASHSNHRFMIDNLTEAVNNSEDLQVYKS